MSDDIRKHLDELYQCFNADYPAGAFRDAMDLLRESEARERELAEENDHFGKLNAEWIAKEERWKDERRELVEALSNLLELVEADRPDCHHTEHPAITKAWMLVHARATGAQGEAKR